MAKTSDYRMDSDVDNKHLEFCSAQHRKQHVDKNTKRQRGPFKDKTHGPSSQHGHMTSEQGRSASNTQQPKVENRNRTLSSGHPASNADPEVRRTRTLTERCQGRPAKNNKGRRYNGRQRSNANQRSPDAATAAAQHSKPQQPVRHPKPRSLILAKLQSNQSDFLRSDDGRCRVYGISVFPPREGPQERVTSTCKYETDWFENQGSENEKDSDDEECDESEPGTYDWTGIITDDPATWVYWTETVEKLIAKTPVRRVVKPWERPNLFSWEIDPRNPNCLFDYSSEKAEKQNVHESDEYKALSEILKTVAKGDEAPIDGCSFEITVDDDKSLSPQVDDSSGLTKLNEKTNTVQENMQYADDLLDRVLGDMDGSSDTTDTDFN